MNIGGELPSGRRSRPDAEEFDRYEVVVAGRRYVVSRRRARRTRPLPDDYAYIRDPSLLLDDDDGDSGQHHTPAHKRARVLVTDAAIHRGLREVTPAADAKLLLQAECAICLQDFSAGDKLSAMPCAHAFHDQCILPWLRRNAACPLCRSPLLPPMTQGDEAAA